MYYYEISSAKVKKFVSSVKTKAISIKIMYSNYGEKHRKNND